jgi:hypothetical protein
VSAAPGGGSGAQIYEVTENASQYIVKFKGNNQGVRVLFNEYVSGRIGEFIGVPFGDHALIEVSDALHPPNGTQYITARMLGIQFATTYYTNANFLPEPLASFAASFVNTFRRCRLEKFCGWQADCE